MDMLKLAIERERRRRKLPAPAVRQEIRRALGLSQLDLAAALGVSRVSISRYETGHRTPRGALLDRYLDVLDRLTQESLRR
jgi:transcriptional regulator with XRE-family HTH domain